MKNFSLKNPVAFICILITICCSLFILILSVLNLPETSLVINNGHLGLPQASIKHNSLKNKELGKFGEMMIEMLPQDLVFTAFLPSDSAFERDLGLSVNGSLTKDKVNDTYAIVSRVLGFSVVPFRVVSGGVELGKELLCDSVSGFGLFVSKDVDGMLVVNRVKAERVDLQRGKIVVHVMDGVIMDAEFEQAVKPDEEEDSFELN